MKRFSLLVSVVSGLVFLCACGGSSSKTKTTTTPGAISVSITPSTQTNIDQGQTLYYDAAVSNDSSNKGVTFSMSGTTCTGAACGTFSGVNTTGATYNTPVTVSANMTVTITATSVADTTKSASGTLVVSPLPRITTTALSAATVGIAYTATLKASGGAGALTWSLVSGSALPAGLTLSSSGTISGTPTTTATTNFTVKVTDSSAATQGAASQTQPLSITVAATAAACGSGSESVLKGQYAFTLRGYNANGFLAAIGSFTTDGKGNITAGMVDSNGALGVQSSAITTTGSSYSVGADNRGCATIVTPFYTFTTRFALEVPISTTSTVGAIEEWEPGSTPYIATGKILQQTPPSTLPQGSWVFTQTGIYGTSQYRTGVAGVITADGNGNFTSGEYDSNVEGEETTFTGLNGTYTTADTTTGRYTSATTLGTTGIYNHRVVYLVSSTQFVELTTDALSATTPILIANGQLQTGSLTITGNLVYFGSGMEAGGTGSFVQFGLVTVSGSSLSATVYEDDAGSWVSPPKTPTCTYAIDSYGKLTTSGSTCGNYPPVFYLTGPNTGVMLGTDPGVLVGQAAPQTSVSIQAGTYFFGTQEPVGQAARIECGTVTATAGGAATGTTDETSVAAPEQAGQAVSETLNVNSDGTFSSSDHPGVILGTIISNGQIVMVDNQGNTYPTILVIETVPTS